MMSRLLRIACAVALLSCLVVGCGGDTFDRVPLSGTVTYEGDANLSGSIVATPAAEGENAPNATAIITDGKFSFPAGKRPAAGSYIFEIYLTGPAEETSSGGESSPEDAGETGGEEITFRKRIDVPEGGRDSVSIELTSADLDEEPGSAVPPSGEI
jgi:hypothetical protein